MTAKRRDRKGRVLMTGESQLKDGRYSFRYTDRCGKRKAIYSWRLTETDRVPEGKRGGEPLRMLENKILRDISDGIFVDSSLESLNDCFDYYFEKRKCGMKETSCLVLRRLYDNHVRDTLGKRPIKNLKYSEIISHYLELYQSFGLGISTISTVHTLINQTLEAAVRDGMLRLNPSRYSFRDFKQSNKDCKKKKHGLTLPEQRRFLTYVESSKRYSDYAPLFIFLLGTGCRIGEALALCWDNVDFKSRTIRICQSLAYTRWEDGTREQRITSPKTITSNREIPMLNKVYDVLVELHKKHNSSHDSSPVIDGHTGFVFVDKNGSVPNAFLIDEILGRIVLRANSDKMPSDPFLPPISCHTLRHTFCMRFCENEPNIKIVQEIMGHASASTTMDIYNEATREAKDNAMRTLGSSSTFF